MPTYRLTNILKQTQPFNDVSNLFVHVTPVATNPG